MKTPLMETIPNFSEGRNLENVEKIVDAFRGKPGVRLLDYSSNPNHNRSVVTAVGDPQALGDAVLEAIGTALSLIDMTKHEGQHPRMGAVDVVPFVPVQGCTIADADALARSVAERASKQHGLPIFLYEKSATNSERTDLAKIRKGQFEGMPQKLLDPFWKPDYGPASVHPTGGVTAIGARMPLIAFNVNLSTASKEIADRIARQVRNISGGFHFVKAIGIYLEDRGIAQVSMNLTDYSHTAIYRALELIRMEAKRWGVTILGSEIVGLVPLQALLQSAEYYLQLENFQPGQVLETAIWSDDGDESAAMQGRSDSK